MITRQLGSEVRWMLRRPRTLIGLFGLILVPIIISFGIWTAGEGDSGPGLAAILSGNGMVVPVFTLFLSLNLLLPLVASIWAADGLAGEAQHGTLRGLLVAPVSRIRLLFVKLFGITAMSLFAVTLMAVVGIIAGTAFLGTNGMMTLSGTTLSFAEGLLRIAFFIVLVTFQMVAVGAVALAISSATEHPLVVQAATMSGIIVFTVLDHFSSLDWLHPFLMTDRLYRPRRRDARPDADSTRSPKGCCGRLLPGDRLLTRRHPPRHEGRLAPETALAVDHLTGDPRSVVGAEPGDQPGGVVRLTQRPSGIFSRTRSSSSGPAQPVSTGPGFTALTVIPRSAS